MKPATKTHRLCPAGDKRCYATERQAWQAAVELAARWRKPYRVYQCDKRGCHSWHLTTQLEERR